MSACPASASSLSVSAPRDRDVLLTAGRGGFATTWQISDKGLAHLQDFIHGLPVEHASFSEDGSRLMTIADDRIGRIWDASSGELIRTLGDPEHVDWVAVRGVPSSSFGREY
jgi:WD40 repeat protein